MCKCIQTCSGSCVLKECNPEVKLVPHRHAKLIKAWADGAKVQIKGYNSNQWLDRDNPLWLSDLEYRIKPTPKPDLSYDIYLCKESGYAPKVFASMETCAYLPTEQSRTWKHNIRIVFDGETGVLKSAEMINK